MFTYERNPNVNLTTDQCDVKVKSGKDRTPSTWILGLYKYSLDTSVRQFLNSKDSCFVQEFYGVLEN